MGIVSHWTPAYFICLLEVPLRYVFFSAHLCSELFTIDFSPIGLLVTNCAWWKKVLFLIARGSVRYKWCFLQSGSWNSHKYIRQYHIIGVMLLTECQFNLHIGIRIDFLQIFIKTLPTSNLLSSFFSRASPVKFPSSLPILKLSDGWFSDYTLMILFKTRLRINLCTTQTFWNVIWI